MFLSQKKGKEALEIETKSMNYTAPSGSDEEHHFIIHLSNYPSSFSLFIVFYFGL